MQELALATRGTHTARRGAGVSVRAASLAQIGQRRAVQVNHKYAVVPVCATKHAALCG